MGELLDLTQWCTEERQKLGAQLEALEAGKFRIHEMQGQAWVDISHQSMEKLRHSIDELDRLLIQYKK